MAEVSVSHVILFIAAVSLSAVVGGAATNAMSDVAGSIEGVGSDFSTEISRSVTVISDPGASVYDAENDTLTLLAKNTGGTRLPTEQDSLLVLVDGRPVNVTAVEVVDGDYWLPGNVARITANATLSDGAHRVVVSVGENRDVFGFPFHGDSASDGDVVFAGSLSTIPHSGAQVTRYLGETPAVVGPAAADFDGDGSPDAPFVLNSTLQLVDADGTTRTLDGNPFDVNTRLAVGRWNGSSTAVFFANESNKDIYRTSPGATPTRVYATDASAVVGIADFDGDAERELIYLDSSANIDYVDPDGTHHETGTTIGSTVEAAGTPRDFDGDGVVRVPFVSGSNNVVLAAADGTITKLSSPSAAKTGVGVDDVDRDDRLEVVYVRSSSNYLSYVNLDDTTGTVYNASGDPITVDTGAGVA